MLKRRVILKNIRYVVIEVKNSKVPRLFVEKRWPDKTRKDVRGKKGFSTIQFKSSDLGCDHTTEAECINCRGWVVKQPKELLNSESRESCAAFFRTGKNSGDFAGRF